LKHISLRIVTEKPEREEPNARKSAREAGKGEKRGKKRTGASRILDVG